MPFLDDRAVIHDQDQIRVANSGESVGNHKACAALHQLAHGLLNEHLGSGINATGRFIQNQDLRIGQEGTRNGQQLLLTRRDVASPLHSEPCYSPPAVS